MGTSETNSTSTIREPAAIRRGPGPAPVLLVGSYLSEAARVVSLDRPVTIGRGHKSAGSGPMPVASVRGQDAEVILHSDGTLSRAHFRIAGASGAWKVEDLDSTNGTFVDGRRVTKLVALSPGSIVLFGNHAGVFRRVSDDELTAIEEDAAAPLGPVATVSPALAVTVAGLRRLAATDADLLFVGETGVGKEIYARAVHAASGRRGDFVAINCASLPSELVESELFGYARGAHSTATRAKQGLVELAEGGTLLLDEIGDMSAHLQVKLFRFLQDRQVLPLGSTRPRRVDVRVMAATSQVSDSVRSDLVGRLGAEPIVIPPLRERPEDIGALVAHFGGAGFRGMDPAAFRALCLYHWPRNVRQLGEVVKRVVTVAGARAIRVEDLPGGVRATLQRGPRVGTARKHRAAPDREVIVQLLGENRGNVAAVAKALGRRWQVVHRWLRRHDLNADTFRK